MLHAEIRSDRDAFHFFGEVNAYNLQTVRQHVRYRSHDDGPVRLRFEIDPGDQDSFAHYTRGWLPPLSRNGAVIDVQVRLRPTARSAQLVAA